MVGAIMMGAHGVARHGVAIEEVKRLGLPEGRVGFCAVLELDGRRRLEPRSSQLRSPVNRERDLVLSLTVLVQYTVFKKVSEREESEHWKKTGGLTVLVVVTAAKGAAAQARSR